jgi:nucleoside-triphosphatase THEP1
LNKEFHCAGDVIIRKDDIATGLASANYLRQRIENVEGQYVVILLDEIGNMAQDTLAEVIKSIKKIEEQNRLIIAVLTQPSRQKEEILINEY